MVKAIITDLDRTLLMTAKKNLSEKTTNIFRQVKYASKLQLDAVTTLHGARTYVGRDTINIPMQLNSVKTILNHLVQIPGGKLL